MPLFTIGYLGAPAIHMPFMAVVFLPGIFELPFELLNRRPILSVDRESLRECDRNMFVCALLTRRIQFLYFWFLISSPSVSLYS